MDERSSRSFEVRTAVDFERYYGVERGGAVQTDCSTRLILDHDHLARTKIIQFRTDHRTPRP